MAIQSILPQVAPSSVGVQRAAEISGGESDFERRLQAAVSSVSDQQNVADVRLSRLASGEEADIHTTMIAMQEADISLRLMVATRDKVVEAYQTVMNIAV
jgi:flagellar hook-basal body complex protein FliE